MSVAADLTVLKRRIDEYLWRDESAPLIRLRAILAEYFLPFARVAIIGGFARDLARKGAASFRSDIDLVVDAPQEEISELAKWLNAKPNRFGGFSHSHPQWKIDFWALETTWAATSGHVRVSSFEDLTQCTFFNWDAILYDLQNRRIVSKPNYLEMLRLSELDINLLPTPSINGNLLRAIRRLLLWNLRAGPQLRDFISEHLNDSSLRLIATTEQALYPNAFLHRFDNVESLLDQLYSPDARAQFNPSFGVQLSFPGMSAESNRCQAIQHDSKHLMGRISDLDNWARFSREHPSNRESFIQLQLPGIGEEFCRYQISPYSRRWQRRPGVWRLTDQLQDN